jgi:hypothetical protein
MTKSEGLVMTEGKKPGNDKRRRVHDDNEKVNGILEEIRKMGKTLDRVGRVMYIIQRLTAR